VSPGHENMRSRADRGYYRADSGGIRPRIRTRTKQLGSAAANRVDDRSWVLIIAATYVGDRAVVVQRKIHNRPEINIKTEVTQFIGGSIVENLG
jgi:hypothetical protein